MENAKVILIGGAPLSGKSTLARRLASTMEYACLATDDLSAAVRTVTSAFSHPALHAINSSDFRKYYVSQTIVQLIMDAEHYQEALWPAVERVIRDHAAWAGPAIIEGWTLQPERVAKLQLAGMQSLWLVTSQEQYERRLRSDEAFWSGAADVEKLVRHFVRRSVWYDLYIRKIAPLYKLPVLEVTPAMSADDVLDAAQALLGAPRRRLAL